MNRMATACVILHKMIVEHRRDSYASDGTAGRSTLFEEDDVENEINFIHASPGVTPLFSNTTVTVSDDIKVSGLHRDLKNALVNHQWNKFGGENNLFRVD